MASSRRYTVTTVEQVEATSGRITGTFTDDAGVGILPDTVTLLLYDVASNSVINARDRQNVKNANGVTISGVGAFEWRVAASDNAIVGTLKTELHRALFEWTFPGGQGKAELDIQVHNLSRVPAV